MTVEASVLDYAPIAPRYDLSRKAEPALVDSLREGLELLKSHTVLEIGAGTGNYGRALAEAGFDLVALDMSAQMLERSSLKTASCRVQGDAMALPLKSNSVDAAINVNVLHHLSEVEKALREMRRVCR